MEKNIVKLNEGQLRKIVAESVKKVISEIDWKTYANAAEKAGAKKTEIEEAIWDLDDEIGKAKEEGNIEKVKSLEAEKEKLQKVLDKHVKRCSDFNDASDNAFTQKYNLDYHRVRPNNFQRLPDNAKIDKFNYNIGNYAYNNENGWHLKEAVDKAVKSVLKESIKEVDPNNVVSKEVAEKFGFRPAYTGFDDGLELWGKHLNFNPLEDYQQASKLLSQLGIKRFTTENWKGNVKITVRNNVNTKKSKWYSPNNSYYQDPKDSNNFGKPWNTPYTF